MSDLRDAIEFRGHDFGFESWNEFIQFFKDEPLMGSSVMFDRRLYLSVDNEKIPNGNTFIEYTPGQAIHVIKYNLEQEGYRLDEVTDAIMNYIEDFRNDKEVLSYDEMVEKYHLDPEDRWFDNYQAMPIADDVTGVREGQDTSEGRKRIKPPMEYFGEAIRTRCLMARVEKKLEQNQKIDNARNTLQTFDRRDKVFEAKKKLIEVQTRNRQNDYLRDVRSTAHQRTNRTDFELLKMKRYTASMRSIEKAAKAQTVESHAQRVKNFWKSPEGHAQYKNMVRMGADISLATRKIHSNNALVANREVPTQKDIKIAERQAREFIESGQSTMEASAIRAMHGCAEKATESVNAKREKAGKDPVKTPRINRVYAQIAGAKMTAKEFVDRAKGEFRNANIMMPYENKSIDDVFKEMDQQRDEAIRQLSEIEVDPQRSQTQQQLPDKEKIELRHKEVMADTSRGKLGEITKDKDMAQDVDLDGVEIDKERSESEAMDKLQDKGIDPTKDRGLVFVEERKIEKSIDQKGERERNEQDAKDLTNSKYVKKAAEVEKNVSDEQAVDSLETRIIEAQLRRKGKEPEKEPQHARQEPEKERKKDRDQDKNRGNDSGSGFER